MQSQEQPEVARQMDEAVRNILDNIKPLFVIGVLVIVAWTLGFVTIRSRKR